MAPAPRSSAARRRTVPLDGLRHHRRQGVLKQRGILKNLDESEEINACTVKVKVDVDGEDQDWLFLFKNETHNHPTEIEPFGGAATCVGGAIRDPPCRGGATSTAQCASPARPTL